eukprot:CAMPEP_0201867376 /NCGR_PEP_ID=MMETSP0902-20130614/1622_1 /ASSEMBLY_ACC=CAM_ASM_000551 /TAXON_ID=420261 /ORGANISM="Thalassiosira antarctica, Strain CCMP982" /LENGTH=394 /DNA_ID=CAMNT_0048392519 /DNA_START=49 /DNA_END=1233 /DNA_ORIENTATION=+
MATSTNRNHRERRPRSRPPKHDFYISLLTTALLALSIVRSQETDEPIDYGNHNPEWEDGPSSWEEFGHDNDPSVCGLPVLTVEEWEAGKYWDGNKPVLVKNMTDGWAALNHWKKQEMIRRYPDAEATMGDGRRVGEVGPDDAGNVLSPTTVKEFITKNMYHPLKYFFDRKIAIPNGMLEDCHPFPMPTRAFLENPETGAIHALSKKKKVNPKPPFEIWQDHLAISIGSDLQGLSFHFHGEAWNVVLFGSKRWLLWDYARFEKNVTRQRHFALAGEGAPILSSAEWIRQLYSSPERMYEMRTHGHDCIQHAGEMMFVPRKWMHMVVNIGDTVSVISEVGLEKGEGKKPEDFEYDPDESSDDSEDWSSDDDSEDDGPPPGWIGPPNGWSSDDSEDE